MIRKFIGGLVLASLLMGFSAPTDNSIDLICQFNNCKEKLVLFQFDGAAFRPVINGETQADGSTSFKVPKSEPSFYYVGTTTQNMIPIVLGQEEEVIMTGNCGNIRNASFQKSDFNNQYNALKAQINQLQQEAGMLARAYQQNFGANQDSIVLKMKALDDKKLTLLEAQKGNDFFTAVVALNTYLSFQNNTLGYNNEVEYFAKEFFRYANFKNPVYDRLPWVYEAFKNYTNTLASVRLPDAKQKECLDRSLGAIEAGRPAYKYALAGVITLLNEKKSPLFTQYAEQFVQVFQESDPAAASDMRKQLDRAKSFMPGGEAPNFTQKTPEGEDLSLSDLRGKVVLLDFWASWCGPCRRENPNVVRLYETYKDKGFDILGVSLDRERERWLAAIQQDGLTWNHVSDLKGWQNEVAGIYGVSSIPHTVLLDAEGKIIAKNLRGEALALKLEELFK
ncbi:MAG TPA: redoxin domain-containing protein [Saprospiraceae bacterium]|nr:redoxin domain-containing protein [Saprospiraceae bacterium]HMQ81989.1 redoxin domain-containing protein [Saprospiraceae bacterium]